MKFILEPVDCCVILHNLIIPEEETGTDVRE